MHEYTTQALTLRGWRQACSKHAHLQRLAVRAGERDGEVVEGGRRQQQRQRIHKESFLPLQLNNWLGKNLRNRSTLLAAMPRMREYVR